MPLLEQDALQPRTEILRSHVALRVLGVQLRNLARV
jgi:hypothetical protein